MRVIAGKARGTRLKVPPRVTRPSADRLREALFSILGARLGGAAVLDLFAGSGALGIEALSRGAARATFVESHRKAVEVIRENLRKAGLEAGATIVPRDVFAELATGRDRYDLIFADPPYASTTGDDLAGRLLGVAALRGRLADDGLVVIEVESSREAPLAAGWHLRDRRVYGSSAILFYAAEVSA